MILKDYVNESRPDKQSKARKAKVEKINGLEITVYDQDAFDEVKNIFKQTNNKDEIIKKLKGYKTIEDIGSKGHSLRLIYKDKQAEHFAVVLFPKDINESENETEDISESTSFTLKKLLDMIDIEEHLGYKFMFKISDPVESIELISKYHEYYKGSTVYVAIDRGDIKKVMKLKIKHADIGSYVICDSDLSRADIEKYIKLEKRNFYFVRPDGSMSQP